MAGPYVLYWMAPTSVLHDLMHGVWSLHAEDWMHPGAEGRS